MESTGNIFPKPARGDSWTGTECLVGIGLTLLVDEDDRLGASAVDAGDFDENGAEALDDLLGPSVHLARQAGVGQTSLLAAQHLQQPFQQHAKTIQCG